VTASNPHLPQFPGCLPPQSQALLASPPLPMPFLTPSAAQVSPVSFASSASSSSSHVTANHQQSPITDELKQVMGQLISNWERHLTAGFPRDDVWTAAMIQGMKKAALLLDQQGQAAATTNGYRISST